MLTCEYWQLLPLVGKSPFWPKKSILMCMYICSESGQEPWLEWLTNVTLITQSVIVYRSQKRDKRSQKSNHMVMNLPRDDHFLWKIFDLNLNSSSFASTKYTEKLRFSCDWQGGTETRTTALTRLIMSTMIYISRINSWG